MREKALGMIEVRGFLGAISVADAALKAANVTLANAAVIRGGYTTIELLGDVAAIEASVAAGVQIAQQLECLIASHVIARIDEQTDRLIRKNITERVIVPQKQKEQIKEAIDNPLETLTKDLQEKLESELFKPLSAKELPLLSLAELREYARKLPLKTMTEQQINIATKNKLIKEILKELE